MVGALVNPCETINHQDLGLTRSFTRPILLLRKTDDCGDIPLEFDPKDHIDDRQKLQRIWVTK